MPKRILLINPPREDAFPEAIYAREELKDEFISYANQPTALLKIATVLKKQGHIVEMIDCAQETDPSNPASIYRLTSIGFRRAGRFHKKEVFHLGMSYETFRKELSSRRQPDEIWISSCMTYHYKPTHRIIEICKEVYPDSLVILGGIYPTLCYEHAKQSKADIIFRGEFAPATFERTDYSVLPYKPDYAIIKLTRGCPYNCSYCAVTTLEGHKMRFRDVDDIFDEMLNIIKHYNIRKFVFWESNLLVNSKNYFEVLLDKIIASDLNISLATPEGIAPNLCTPGLVHKMRKAGFAKEMIYLPLETIDLELNKRFNRVSNPTSVEQAIDYFIKDGHHPRLIGVFILMAMPEQPLESVLEGVAFCWKKGVLPLMMPFTPIPQTQEYEKYKHLIQDKGLEELHPLLFPFADIEVPYEVLEEVYMLCEEINPIYAYQFSETLPVRSFIKRKLTSDIALLKITRSNFIIMQYLPSLNKLNKLRPFFGDKILCINYLPEHLLDQLNIEYNYYSFTPAFKALNHYTTNPKHNNYSSVIDFSYFIHSPSHNYLKWIDSLLTAEGVFILNVFSEFGEHSSLFIKQDSLEFFSEEVFKTKEAWKAYFERFFNILHVYEDEYISVKTDSGYELKPAFYTFVLGRK